LIGTLASWQRRAATLLAVGAALALLSGCTGQTTIDQASTIGNYDISFGIMPERLNPPQRAALNYGFTDAKTNKPVTKFDTVDGAMIHNVLFSRDLKAFQHSYASVNQLNAFSISTEFAETGKYYSYTLFKPTGSDLQVLTGTVQSGDAGNAPDLRVDTDPLEAYGAQYALVLGGTTIHAGAPAQLAVYVTERGSPVTQLWPFLGAPGYLWIIDENGQSFAVETGASESHPNSGSSAQQAPPPTIGPDLQTALTKVAGQPAPTMLPAQQTAQVSVVETPGAVVPDVGYGPSVVFTHTFPHPGLFKVWAELEYRGQVQQLGWVLNVAP
jgi:hypothetical protein